MTPSPAPAVVTRDARDSDLDTLVEFNRRLAEETESKALDVGALRRGVAAELADPGRLRYWVAVDPADPDRPLGQAAVTREWSDWRNGWIWWFQSVYTRAEARGRGVFRALHGAIRDAARAEADVVGLRLYVERENAAALRTYEALGLVPGGYLVYEEIWPERFGGRAD